MPNSTPKTIAELKAWYIAHHLPPEDITRFFIGRNIQEPRAFGIYQEGDQFIVYKNKDNGSRAVRYHGPDEAYAVNELYTRLKQEIAQQKGRNAEARAEEDRKNRTGAIISTIIAAVVCIVIVIYAFRIVFHEPDTGYYHNQDNWYYYGNETWFEYTDDGWTACSADPSFADSCQDYYYGTEAIDEAVPVDPELVDTYAKTDTDSSWSSSDSWDSDSTDWSSDW